MNLSNYAKNSKSGEGNLLQSTAICLIRMYQLILSPFLAALLGPGFGCRFYPTCSQYAIDAIKSYGALKGGWLAVKRLLRCQPFAQGGIDPVPQVIRLGARKS